MLEFKTGDRVIVFDPQLFVDDKITPPATTHKLATIIRGNYSADSGLGYINHDLIDVTFDHRPEIVSHAHFANYVKFANRR